MNSIKSEPGQLQDPRIKPEPESAGASPAAHTDEDIYEEAGDLEFGDAQQPPFFLTRIPKFLWESWSKLDDNQEIRVGTVRVEGGLNDIKRMSLMLSHDLPTNRAIPKEYNMHITDPNSVNTFIFSEQDLPGFRKYSHDRAPPRFRDRRRIEKPRNPQGNFRRAIPKQTHMAGQVKTEINCLPVENQEHQQYMENVMFRALDAKPKLKISDNALAASGGNLLNPGVLGAAGNISGFTLNAKPNKMKKQENKAIRMPQNLLLDALFEAFKEYQYWGLKELKSRLVQPESYLKETLDKIAVLIKGGPYNLTYRLKPEATEDRYLDFNNVKAEVAPEVASPGLGYDGAMDDDDDDNVKMEDIILE